MVEVGVFEQLLGVEVKLAIGVHKGNLVYPGEVEDRLDKIFLRVFLGMEEEFLEDFVGGLGGSEGYLLVLVDNDGDLVVVVVLGVEEDGPEVGLELQGVEVVVVLEGVCLGLDGAAQGGGEGVKLGVVGQAV